MEKFYTALKIIGGLAGVILAGLTFYFTFIHKPQTVINVEKSSEILLTKPLDIDGVTSKYTYRDNNSMQLIEFENLWRTIYTIRNVGDVTIYGDGFAEPTIINSSIPLTIQNCDNVLSIKVVNCNNSAFIINENVTVAQWHPNEFIEIEVISSGIESPILTINDRNIKDGKVEYSVYSPEENVEHKRIADRIPEELANVIKVIYIGIIIVLLVAHLASHPVDSGDPKFDKEVRRNSNWIVFIALIIASIPFLWMF